MFEQHAHTHTKGYMHEQEHRSILSCHSPPLLSFSGSYINSSSLNWYDIINLITWLTFSSVSVCAAACGGSAASVTRMSDVPLIQRRRRSSNVADKRNGSSSLFQNSIQRCMIKPLHHLQTSITDERPPPHLVQINFCRRRSGWGRWTDLKTLQESSSLLCIHSLVL